MVFTKTVGWNRAMFMVGAFPECLPTSGLTWTSSTFSRCHLALGAVRVPQLCFVSPADHRHVGALLRPPTVECRQTRTAQRFDTRLSPAQANTRMSHRAHPQTCRVVGATVEAHHTTAHPQASLLWCAYRRMHDCDVQADLCGSTQEQLDQVRPLLFGMEPTTPKVG